MLILPRRYGQQKPPLGTQIARGHPLAQRMIYCVLFNDGGGLKVTNLVNGMAGAVTLSDWRSGSRGEGLGFPTVGGAGSKVDFGTAGETILPLSGGFTAITAYRKTDTTNRNSGAFGNGSFGATTIGTHIPYGDGTVYWQFGGATEDVTKETVAGLAFGDDVWAFTTGTRGMEIWQNGILRSSNAANPSRTSGGSFEFGRFDGDGTDLAVWGYFYAWARQLSKDEIMWLYTEPYAFLSAPRRLWVDVAAAAGGIQTLVGQRFGLAAGRGLAA